MYLDPEKQRLSVRKATKKWYDADRPARRAQRKRWNNANPGILTARRKKKTKRNFEIVRESKSKPCMDCGIQYPYYVMQFDHVGKKTFMLGGGLCGSVGFKKLRAEIAACEVVCGNCHAIRTQQRRFLLPFVAVTRSNYALQFGRVAA